MFFWLFSGILFKKFFCLCRSYESNPEDSLQQLKQLTTESNLSLAVRVGDVYAFIIQHHYASQDYNQVVLPLVLYDLGIMRNISV